MRREVMVPKGLWNSAQFHFSHAVRARELKDLLVISGQVGIDEQTRVVEGFDAQCRLAFQSIARIVEQAGGTMANIIKVNAYFCDISKLPDYEKVLAEYFPDGAYPAQTVIEVKSLALPNLLLEIEALAAF